jgi:hypothetical protein
MGVSVKRVRWTIVMLGLLGVFLILIIPPADDPATAFNETDTPVNLTAPVTSGINFVLPARHSVAVLRDQYVWWKPSTMMDGVTPKPGIRASHSVLNLLCELLC